MDCAFQPTAFAIVDSFSIPKISPPIPGDFPVIYSNPENSGLEAISWILVSVVMILFSLVILVILIPYIFLSMWGWPHALG